MANVSVISLGGSIVAPDQVDVGFIRSFREVTVRYLETEPENRLVLVVGGGAPARAYQKAYREIADETSDVEADWIGVAATRLNAQLLAAVFAPLCSDAVVIDPVNVNDFHGRVLVAAGWKPGFSTDYDAVLLAQKFGASTIVNLTNIARVYTADPKIDPTAMPVDRATWKEFRGIVGDRWVPGKNAPFDPVATKLAAELGLRVIVASGRDIGNIEAILSGDSFTGTIIGPE